LQILFLFWVSISFSQSFWSAWSNDTLCDFTESIPSMGTVFILKTVEPCKNQDHPNLVQAIHEKLTQLDSAFSLYQSKSPIRVLNETGILSSPSQEFIQLTTLSLNHRQNTQGYFNPLVLPVLNLIKKAFKEKNSPPQLSEIDALKPLLNPGHLSLKKEEINLKPGAMITYDGQRLCR
jgi:thiamine biosynthesis lipoprotein ApbE